jgi:hypothetical protein
VDPRELAPRSELIRIEEGEEEVAGDAGRDGAAEEEIEHGAPHAFEAQRA